MSRTQYQRLLQRLFFVTSSPFCHTVSPFVTPVTLVATHFPFYLYPFLGFDPSLRFPA